SSRPTWHDGSRARRLLRYSLVFRLRDLIQRSLHVGQCPEDLPPRFVLLLQARRSRPMMRAVQGGVTLLESLALHGFLQRAHHEVGFLHEFVDQMGPFPWFHAWPPFRLLVVPATLRTQPALPFRLLKIFHEGTHRCQARAHPLPYVLLVLQDRSLVRARRGMAGVRSFVLRTLLGSAGVLQCLHVLVGCLQQRVDQCNACMQCHACAPWQGVCQQGTVSRMAALMHTDAQPIACLTFFA